MVFIYFIQTLNNKYIFLFSLFFQFRLAYVAPESRVVGAGDLVDHPKKIALNYLQGCFLIDLFVVLPLPQVTLSLSISLSLIKRFHVKLTDFLTIKIFFKSVKKKIICFFFPHCIVDMLNFLKGVDLQITMADF